MNSKSRWKISVWGYKIIILLLTCTLLWNVVSSRKKPLDTGTSSIFNQVWQLTRRPVAADSLPPNFTLVVVVRASDCASCLDMIFPVKKLHKRYPRNYLQVLGLFVPASTNSWTMEQFIKYFKIQFPFRQTFPGSVNLPTPTVLLFNQNGDIRYVQPPAATRAERMLFSQTVELII